MKTAVRLLSNFLKNKDWQTLNKYGRIIGLLLYYILRSRRSVVAKNLEITTGKSNKKLQKSVFKNNFASFMEIFFAPKINEQFIVNNVEIDNEKDIREFIRKNKKFVLVSAHIGSWELAPPIISKVFKTRIAVIGRRIKNPYVDSLVADLRSSGKVEYLHHRNITGNIYEYLENNVPIGVLLDHSATKKDSIYVDFFGLRTTFNAGIPAICIRKNIPALICFCIRESGRIKLISYPPVYPDSKLKLKSRVRMFAKEINTIYEDIIKKYPDQWLMLHKRFKRLEQSDGKKTDSIYRS
ncbi:lysophospholipid acyltransferase family protein [Flexistipes sp.]|uniref:lysophospholipid acyltransferase family protein n=1 Tax=Flexistipes sp. TaxID=3088135 RepID=UPI002E1BDB2E|nr:lysophospholipid acyltransferase family protein [Flexistipes sp.]